MKEIIVKPGQCIIDICIEHYGSPNAMYDLHKLNNFDEVPALISAGDVVKVAPELSEHTNSKHLRLMRKQTIANKSNLQGIGYWHIESDFIIS